MNPEQAIADVFGLYEQYGTADYIGEPVSQLEHMSQAAQLAMAEGVDDEVVLAAFFHDIGHLCGQGGENMDGYGVVSHERLGADYLRRAGFSERMAKLVEYHVQAKRYLTFVQPDYYARLSEASRRTLAYQGGVMSAEEARAFEQDPLCAVSLRMRHWDEQAKGVNVPVLDVEVLKVKARGMLR
ncbi:MULTISPECIES: phosphonate degradation HD-domain oxygenase [Pseudomonas fluorescens group]|uniref:HD_domain domain-containing protein n=4 Tax=Pseudomonas fluorescens group TaxID=136843 RepID=C3K3Q0_PSEFS|nr:MULTISPECIES: phosphonate degradation HD-domain oxygenase [Pseudomonas fluorescens group]MBZ6459177.1 HD domain-containing protein [Pseudomonas fluorescens group sp.]MBZ6460981.1 HD domain-containing protein [Pseudomonas fluorescens group sp.]MBZ6469526.1 HD domain-containing protein [Pseudomonas fluorescens group sp.]MCM2376482.1 HD domain-containing protein [Pseudomonas marginalis]OAJ47629.1 phosphohydrolase [Pseudomonas marginalis]